MIDIRYSKKYGRTMYFFYIDVFVCERGKRKKEEGMRVLSDTVFAILIVILKIV